jgi:hypothetical protein
MDNYHITIMSIDPNDHYGREQGDDSQKYGFSVQAKSQRDAEDKGAEEFKQRHGNLPIFWLKASKD